ncbi:phospholipid carrier-dependent glycosyltransferase [Altererythrobacter sp. MF3-039]|uniref:phospholipid carrier-dependent glycosyltransferase n=1 Tax=Altererythrobacter sp. MF3-039 TaxID=3252901 RepID=UPI00390CCAAF
MSYAPPHPRDPIGWCWAIATLFGALIVIRINIPSQPLFDEVHYLPAARALIDGAEALNREHPPLGKELIAAGMAMLGDAPLGWRLFPALAGVATLFASCRALWFASFSHVATIAFGVLLGSGFILFIQSRIAMLDIFMACFCAIAAWQFAAAIREPERGRIRLALAGTALGLAAASKWNALPLLPLPGLAFLAARIHATGWRAAWSSRGAPVPGISLAEAALWLGLVPFLAYWLTFWPVTGGLDLGAFIARQQEMIALHQSVLELHPYQSTWPDWVLNVRAIWYLYEPVDGAQRGVMLIGNPLTMLLGLGALGWCAWAAIKHRRVDCLSVVVIYLASLGAWFVADKPVQFYYHYFVPSIALLAALALLVDELWRDGWRRIAMFIPAASIAIFAWFYPILSAAPLGGPQAFTTWMWLDSWR